jgi:CRP-like cAMP-binding protein
VEIVKKSDAGEVVLGTLGTGGMFGEMALIDDKPRMASARAVGKASVTVIPRQLMDRKIAEMDPFARGLTRILMDHVRTMAKSMDGKAT